MGINLLLGHFCAEYEQKNKKSLYIFNNLKIYLFTFQYFFSRKHFSRNRWSRKLQSACDCHVYFAANIFKVLLNRVHKARYWLFSNSQRETLSASHRPAVCCTKREQKNMKGFLPFNWKILVTKYFEDPCCFLSSFLAVRLLSTLTNGAFILGIVCMSNSSNSSWFPRKHGRRKALQEAEAGCCFHWIYEHFFKIWIGLFELLLESDSERSHNNISFANTPTLWYSTIYGNDNSVLRPPVFFFYIYIFQPLMGLARLNPAYHSFNRVLCAQRNASRCHDCCMWWGRGEGDVEMSHGRRGINSRGKEMKTLIFQLPLNMWERTKIVMEAEKNDKLVYESFK